MVKPPHRPPRLEHVLRGLAPDRLAWLATTARDPTVGGQYRHWSKLQHLTLPEAFTDHEEWWASLKLARSALARPLPLRDVRGEPFRYGLIDPIMAMLHEIDSQASGRVGMPDPITNPATRDRYLVSSLIEEAVTSSQLEGAATTRRVAVDMLRTGRPPRDTSEHMIASNYRGMQHVRSIRDLPMTPQRLLELHRILTHTTLPASESGALQREGDTRVAVRNESGRILHDPPPASQLESRLARLCAFANEPEGADRFVHPVIRAIVLHFWLAYDHPFTDGNGRTARALFYWSMLARGYWLFEFVSISTLIRKAPSRYARAFLYTETDDNDLTYFILFHIGVIHRALKELNAWIARKIGALHATQRLLRDSRRYNHRQLALLHHALRHPNATYTIRSHRTSHDIAYATARSDLTNLVQHGLLQPGPTHGRAMTFVVPPDLEIRLRQSDDAEAAPDANAASR